MGIASGPRAVAVDRAIGDGVIGGTRRCRCTYRRSNSERALRAPPVRESREVGAMSPGVGLIGREGESDVIVVPARCRSQWVGEQSEVLDQRCGRRPEFVAVLLRRETVSRAQGSCGVSVTGGRFMCTMSWCTAGRSNRPIRPSRDLWRMCCCRASRARATEARRPAAAGRHARKVSIDVTATRCGGSRRSLSPRSWSSS